MSSILKKLLTGLTGLFLVLFVLVHMLGNLSAFSPDPDAYNAYSHKLLSLGPLLWIVEIGLIVVIAVHAVLGVLIWLGKRRARPTSYDKYRSAGQPSRQTWSSRSMILTGVILLLFIVLHVWTFKYGPGVAEGYVANLHGEEVRDIRRLLVEKFQHPGFAFGYTAIMLLLFLHLRHGIWSAFQSLGAMSPRMTPIVYLVGGVLAVLIAIGFFVLPLAIYFGGVS